MRSRCGCSTRFACLWRWRGNKLTIGQARHRMKNIMASEFASEPPVVWRTKRRATLYNDYARQVSHCVDRGLIGIGWGIEGLPSRSSMAVVFDAIENNPEHGWGKRSLSIVRRFATQAKVGDFVWTRDTSGQYL